MRVKDVITESGTRWLLIIDGKPVAHYPNKIEANNMKRQLTLKLGMKYKIEIREVPADEYRIGEALVPANRDESGRWATRWVLSVRRGNNWEPVALYRTQAEAEEQKQELTAALGKRYRIEMVDYPKTQYTEDATC